MEELFAERRKEFEQVLELIKSIKKLSSKTKTSITKINELYITLTTNNTDPVELFGLDFFNFQYEIYSKHYDGQINLLNFLNNRIYGDYYKLYKLILSYVKDNVQSSSIQTIVESNSNLPKYNKLDDKVTYPDEVLKTINVFVINILEQLNSLYNDKTSQMSSKQKLSQKGFCIGNFVQTVKHKNEMLKNQIVLYEEYIKFFNENHIKILCQIKEKIQKIYEEISSDINFNTHDEDSDHDETQDNQSDISSLGGSEALLMNEISPSKLNRQASIDEPNVTTVIKTLGVDTAEALNKKEESTVVTTRSNVSTTEKAKQKMKKMF